MLFDLANVGKLRKKETFFSLYYTSSGRGKLGTRDKIEYPTIRFILYLTWRYNFRIHKIVISIVSNECVESILKKNKSRA